MPLAPTMPINCSFLANEIYGLLNVLKKSPDWRYSVPELPFGKLGVQLGMSSFGPASERMERSSSVRSIEATGPQAAQAHHTQAEPAPPRPSTAIRNLQAAYDRLCAGSEAALPADGGYSLPIYHRVLLAGTAIGLENISARNAMVTALQTLLTVLHESPASLATVPMAVIFPWIMLLRAGAAGLIILATLQSLERIVKNGHLESMLQVNGRALSALQLPVPVGLNHPLPPEAATAVGPLSDYQQILVVVASAASQCRFEASNPATDEQVLIKILEVMNAVLNRPGGFLLTNDVVCEMLETTISLSCQTRINPLLRSTSETFLLAWVRLLFGELPRLIVDAGAGDLALPSSRGESPSTSSDPSSSTTPMARRNSTLTRRINPQEGPHSVARKSPAISASPLISGEPMTSVPSAASSEAWIQLRYSGYGLPALLELFRVLGAVLNPHDLQYTDTMRLIALNALNQAFETNGPAILDHPSFQTQIANDLLKYLYQIAETDFLPLMATALRLVTNILPQFRRIHKEYFQTFFALFLARLSHPALDTQLGNTSLPNLAVEATQLNELFEGQLAPLLKRQRDVIPHFRYSLAGNHFPSVVLQRVRPLPTPQHRLLFCRALDQLTNITEDPAIISDLWVLFDSDLYTGNLWEMYLSFLCQHSLPHIEVDLMRSLRKAPPPDSLSPAPEKGRLVPETSATMPSPPSWAGTQPPAPVYAFQKQSAHLLQIYSANPDQWNAAFREESQVCTQKLTAILQAMVARAEANAPNQPDSWTSLVALLHPPSTTSPDGTLPADPRQPHPYPLPEGEAMALEQLLGAQTQKTTLLFAAALFNHNPKQGIRFLAEVGFLPPSNSKDPPSSKGSDPPTFAPENLDEAQVLRLALFLRHTPSLNKALLGDYLSRPKHLPVLRAYINLFDFQGLRLDEALRILLTQFRIPGESQQIERVVETFAERYCQSQLEGDSQLVSEDGSGPTPEVANPDAAFVLSYASIMLNTDQHSPQVKTRMKLDDFCRNLRGVNAGQNFSSEYLEAVFDGIRRKEIIIPEEHDRVDRFDEVWEGLHTPGRSELDSVSSSSGELLATLRPTTLDGLLFALSYRRLLMNFSQVLLKCSDDEMLRSALTGLYLCAQLAVQYQVPGCIEELVSHLCTIAGVLEDYSQTNLLQPVVIANPSADPSPEALAKTPKRPPSTSDPWVSSADQLSAEPSTLVLTDLSLQLGRDYRGQVALIFMLGLARWVPQYITAGWTLIWRTVLSLACADLLEGTFFTLHPSGTLTLDIPVASRSPSPNAGACSPPATGLTPRSLALSPLANSRRPSFHFEPSAAIMAEDRLRVRWAALPDRLYPTHLPVTLHSSDGLAYFPDPTTDDLFRSGEYSQIYLDKADQLAGRENGPNQSTDEEADGSLFSTLSSYFMSSYPPESEKPSASQTTDRPRHFSGNSRAGDRSYRDLLRSSSSSQLMTKKAAPFQRSNSSYNGSGGSGGGGGSNGGNGGNGGTPGLNRWDAPLDLLIHLTKSARTAVQAACVTRLFRDMVHLDTSNFLKVLHRLHQYLPTVAVTEAEYEPSCQSDSQPDAVSDTQANERWVYHRGEAFFYEQWLRLTLANVDRLDAIWSEVSPPIEHLLSHATQFPTFMIQRTLGVLFNLAQRVASQTDGILQLIERGVQTFGEQAAGHPQQCLLHHPSLATPLVDGLWGLWRRYQNVNQLAADPEAPTNRLRPLTRLVLEQAQYSPETKALAWQLIKEWIGSGGHGALPPALAVQLVSLAAHYLPDDRPSYHHRETHVNNTTAGTPELVDEKVELQLTGQILECALRLLLTTPHLADRHSLEALDAWARLDLPLLQTLLRPCIHPHRGIRQLATARFQQALALVNLTGRITPHGSPQLTHSAPAPAAEAETGAAQRLRQATVWTIWSQVFDQLFFPTLKTLLHPALMMEFDARGYEETCTRLVSLVSSFFLRHLHGPVLETLAVGPGPVRIANAVDTAGSGDTPDPSTEEATPTPQPPFPRVWLLWLDLMVACLNRMEEWGLSKEVVVEHLKNMLLILASLGAFDNVLTDPLPHAAADPMIAPAASDDPAATKNALWSATWNKLGWVLPDLKDELFPELNTPNLKQADSAPEPVGNEVGATVTVMASPPLSTDETIVVAVGSGLEADVAEAVSAPLPPSPAVPEESGSAEVNRASETVDPSPSVATPAPTPIA
ncbi:GDP/GTP exchange factor for ARF [Dimargaris cristalligena]|nr:GDP/GTP exchange factor for ARF [Dimargaris cristalligena]